MRVVSTRRRVGGFNPTAPVLELAFHDWTQKPACPDPRCVSSTEQASSAPNSFVLHYFSLRNIIFWRVPFRCAAVAPPPPPFFKKGIIINILIEEFNLPCCTNTPCPDHRLADVRQGRGGVVWRCVPPGSVGGHPARASGHVCCQSVRPHPETNQRLVRPGVCGPNVPPGIAVPFHWSDHAGSRSGVSFFWPEGCLFNLLGLFFFFWLTSGGWVSV